MKIQSKRLNLIRGAALSAAIAFSTSGCVSQTAFDPTPTGVSQTNPTPGPSVTPGPNPQAGADNFSPPAIVNSTKVDLVFIVDNSGSMGDNQTKLIASLNSFIDQFVMRAIDWRIALLSTDVSNNFGSACYSNYAAPKAVGNWLTKYAGVPWIGCDSNGMCNTTDVVNKFKANVNLGTCGSGDERAIDSLMAATDAAHLAGANMGFFRADAHQAFIIVSDENHGNPSTYDGVNATSVNLINSAISRAKDLGASYSFHFVIDLGATPANNQDGNGTNEYPAFYRAMANATGSGMLDISNSNWGTELVQVGDDIITTAQNEFKLSRVPIGGTIKVYVNNVLIAEDAANGYQYHSAPKNSIELYGAAKAAAAGGALRVEYMYNP